MNNGGRKTLQVFLLNTKLIVHSEQERRLGVVAKSFQVFFRAGSSPEAQYFEKYFLVILPIFEAKIRDPEAVTQRENFRLLRNIPCADLLAKQLREHGHFRGHVRAAVRTG